VGASGGTHAGGGALDFSRFRRDGREWNWNELCTIALCLRQVGFAAWPRERIAGTWERHVHAEALGCAVASPAAKNQWTAYKNRRDGLKGNAPDPLTHYDITWEQFHAAHPYVLEDVMASLDDVRSAVSTETAKVLRSEGVSGAGAILSTPIHRAGGGVDPNSLTSLGAVVQYFDAYQIKRDTADQGLRDAIDALTARVDKLSAQLKPYVDGPEAPESDGAPESDEIAPH
jgi:hypothetical protein